MARAVSGSGHLRTFRSSQRQPAEFRKDPQKSAMRAIVNGPEDKETYTVIELKTAASHPSLPGRPEDIRFPAD
jgi:hypothetical protein